MVRESHNWRGVDLNGKFVDVNAEISSNVIWMVALAGIRLLSSSCSSCSTLEPLISSCHSRHPPLVGNHSSSVLIHTQTYVMFIVFKFVLQILLGELNLFWWQNILILALSLAFSDGCMQLKLLLLKEAGCTSAIFFIDRLLVTLNVISTLGCHEHTIKWRRLFSLCIWRTIINGIIENTHRTHKCDIGRRTIIILIKIALITRSIPLLPTNQHSRSSCITLTPHGCPQNLVAILRRDSSITFDIGLRWVVVGCEGVRGDCRSRAGLGSVVGRVAAVEAWWDGAV